MSIGNTHPTAPPATTDSLKSWIMVVLTLIFVVLYGAALFGWLRPLADDRMVMRLEPIIFVVIGYYFGRLPGQQNERVLAGEINRQTQRADAAQSAKEQALQENEALDEKIRNVRAALSSEIAASTTASGAGGFAPRGIAPADGLGHVVSAAVRILDS